MSIPTTSSFWQKTTTPFGRLGQTLAGWATDFWKDGGKAIPGKAPVRTSLWTAKARAALDRQIADAVAACAPDPQTPRRDAQGQWQARPGEVEAALAETSTLLIRKLAEPGAPSAYTLCLGARAGDMALQLTRHDKGTAIALTGDPDLVPRILALAAQADLTDRAAFLAITPDALRTALRAPIRFDRVIADNPGAAMFHRRDYLTALRSCLAPEALFSFTEPVDNGAEGLESALAGWHAAGLDIRLHEDIGAIYRRHLLTGLTGFVAHVGALKAQGILPDAATRTAIGAHLAEKAQQVAAIDQGARVYHFQACLIDG